MIGHYKHQNKNKPTIILQQTLLIVKINLHILQMWVFYQDLLVFYFDLPLASGCRSTGRHGYFQELVIDHRFHKHIWFAFPPEELNELVIGLFFYDLFDKKSIPIFLRIWQWQNRPLQRCPCAEVLLMAICLLPKATMGFLLVQWYNLGTIDSFWIPTSSYELLPCLKNDQILPKLEKKLWSKYTQSRKETAPAPVRHLF